ncbi:MAG TPA: hypothetical protein GXX51_07285 [Firmicutes bacterium]|nr:hypothetical protein [Bacillota bacterium]
MQKEMEKTSQEAGTSGNMSGLAVERKGCELVINGISSFSLYHTLECGQTFRWRREGDCYEGIVRGRALRLRQNRGDSISVWIPASAPDNEVYDILSLVREYFCLDSDHAGVELRLREVDPLIGPAIDYASGLRLVKQDPWECLISFIISARNRIPLIIAALNKLSRRFGRPVAGPEGATFWAFPGPEELSRASEADIHECGVGFRSGYVLDAARAVANGEFDLNGLSLLSLDEARQSLMQLRGVGRKVADCVLLFAFQRYEAFPIDVWMERVMRYLYFRNEPVTLDEIQTFARRRFGDLAGFAQEYLYHYARNCLAEELRAWTAAGALDGHRSTPVIPG